MNKDVSREFRLLCLLARRVRSPEDMEQIGRIVGAQPDWKAVVEGAARNRVTPLVLTTLRNCVAADVPADIIATLQQHALTLAQRSLAKIPAIEKLSEAFTAAGIRFLVLKGLPLSIQLYGNAAQRPADDIDLLVDVGQFWSADRVLTEVGYRRELGALSIQQKKICQSWSKDLKYVNEDSGVIVELHHRLTANPHLLPYTFEALWAERVQVRIGNADVSTLSPHQLVLYLCAHGANHGWERLRWLVDLAAVLRDSSAIRNAIRDADAAGLGAPMLQALLLANRQLGLPVPEPYLERSKTDRRVRWLERCHGHFSGGATWRRRPAANSLEWLWRYSFWFGLYNLTLKASWRYRCRQVASSWIVVADWQLIKLPDPLIWLYPVLRPVGWAMRRWWR